MMASPSFMTQYHNHQWNNSTAQSQLSALNILPYQYPPQPPSVSSLGSVASVGSAGLSPTQSIASSSGAASSSSSSNSAIGGTPATTGTGSAGPAGTTIHGTVLHGPVSTTGCGVLGAGAGASLGGSGGGTGSNTASPDVTTTSAAAAAAAAAASSAAAAASYGFGMVQQPGPLEMSARSQAMHYPSYPSYSPASYYNNMATSPWFAQETMYGTAAGWHGPDAYGLKLEEYTHQTQAQRRCARCTCPNCINELSGS
uniref:Uncharacterized protein n=1 Tax=Anopheles albimanus TaxID=7167 RepID=A0A182FJL9_ANOAL